MKNISTCLWFAHQAEEATNSYASVFANGKIGRSVRYGKAGSKVSGQPVDSLMTIELQIDDLSILALNGGPRFKFTPALSFIVSCATDAEIEDKWKKLSAGGNVRMGLDKYPWADKYGWTADKFGAEWQLIQAPRPQKIVPAFLFVDALFGKGEEALNFYMSAFPNSKVETMARDEKTNSVMHCAFTLNGQGFALMEGQGTHGYGFSHATSLVANCETQAEIDTLWEKLSAGGTIEECGWLTDKFGVSWQIAPTILGDLMTDPRTSEKAMSAMLTMKKIDIAALKKATE